MVEGIYTERISGMKTIMLFITLTLLFALLFIWRADAAGLDFLAGVLLFFCVFFLFYTINYRTLLIRITDESLKLTFGIFHWTVPLQDITDCRLDELSPFMRYGGAGIHFMTVGSRYRASFNFLEYPRVVIAFKRKKGPVQDISFSTRQPEEVQQIIHARISPKSAA